MGRRGFTLLELIVVIIIIGILATLGFIQYQRIVEKGRKAEARSVLGSLRTLQRAYYEDTGSYGTVANLDAGVPDTTCNATYYFRYQCTTTNGICTAYRCTASGKTPNVGTGNAYTISLAQDGSWTGAGPWQ